VPGGPSDQLVLRGPVDLRPCGLRLLQPLIVWGLSGPVHIPVFSVIFKGIMFSHLYFLSCYICCISQLLRPINGEPQLFWKTCLTCANDTRTSKCTYYVLILALRILSPRFPARYLILNESDLLCIFSKHLQRLHFTQV